MNMIVNSLQNDYNSALAIMQAHIGMVMIFSGISVACWIWTSTMAAIAEHRENRAWQKLIQERTSRSELHD
jgi:hypothetical protein